MFTRVQIVLLSLALASTAPVVFADGVGTKGEVPGGDCLVLTQGVAAWEVCDILTTDNGLPTGGECGEAVAGSGIGVREGTFVEAGDAFDDAGFWVNGVRVGGELVGEGSTASSAPQSMGDLRVSVRYDALPGGILRAYLSIQNIGASALAAPVTYAINFGSDDDTQVFGSQSGDTTFTVADRWVLTADGDPPSDPANTTVLFSGTPPVVPELVSDTVFECSSTNGVLAQYPLSIPAGATRALVFFQQLGLDIDDSLVAAADFDDIAAESSLLAGLSSSDIAAIQNIGIGGGGTLPPAVPQPSVIPVNGFSSVFLLVVLAAMGVWTVNRRS